MNQTLTLTTAWDKTFPKNDAVSHRKVTFRNRYGITLAADLYAPRSAAGRLPAIAVCGPFGAVKEQASGLYAQTMAGHGFLALAFDPSFTGESGGEPRYMASPDINTEDFQAAVDFLSTQEAADPKDRHHWHLRLGRPGPERRRAGHPHQGHRRFHHVRHGPRERQGLLRR